MNRWPGSPPIPGVSAVALKGRTSGCVRCCPVRRPTASEGSLANRIAGWPLVFQTGAVRESHLVHHGGVRSGRDTPA